MRGSFGNFRPMEVDKKKVGQRLRAVMQEAGFKTTEAFAVYLGKNRGAVDSWLNGRALPPVQDLGRLRQEHGVTLDWLFYEDGQTMQHGVLIRLEAALMGMDVPEVEPGIGPETLQESSQMEALPHPGRKTRKAT